MDIDTDNAIDLVRVLEEGMWQARTRFNSDWLKRHVHSDLLEFGRSGRVYDYHSLFPPVASKFRCELPLPNFKASVLDTAVVLTTFDSHAYFGETVEHAHRTSIWIFDGDYWQMRMHQGTPFDPEIVGQ